MPVNDIPEITCRHHAELAMTWWRRETSPMLLLRGQFRHQVELDQKMWAYMDGAGLNPTAVFRHLIKNQRLSAPDFAADIVAAFLAMSVGGTDEVAGAWLATVQAHPHFMFAVESAQRWLGRTNLTPGEPVDADSERWHPSRHLRFIDGLGQVQGQLLLDADVGFPGDISEPREQVSRLLTEVLLLHEPDPSGQWVGGLMDQGYDPQIVLLAAGVAGDAHLLEWLVECSSQPEIAVLALDAFRRITGFDAIATVQAERQLVSTIAPTTLAMASQNASQWLESDGQAISGDTTFFLGKPVTREHLLDVVQSGYQLDREVAAMRLLHEAEPCHIPVRSNCQIQARAIANYFS